LVDIGSADSEIKMLNDLLTLLGYDAGEGDDWSYWTLLGVQQLASDLGVSNLKTVTGLDPSWLVWIPAETFAVQSTNLVVGTPAPAAGEPVFIGPPSISRATVAASTGGALPAGTDGTAWVLRYGDVAISYEATAITDTVGLAQLSAVLSPDELETVSAQLQRTQPVLAWELPATAIVTDGEGSTCVFVLADSDFRSVPIRTLSGEIGVTRIAGELPATGTFLTNPTQVIRNATCD
jgi:hypothetical protein